jgi:predicted RND superfamily exporter protein
MTPTDNVPPGKLSPDKTGIDRIFRFAVSHAKLVIACSMMPIVAALWFLPSLQKDTRADAFLAPDNPALIYRDRVRAIFGLSDPIVVAVAAQDKHGLFTPEILEIVETISDRIAELPNVNADRVNSLAEAENITGDIAGIAVSSFLDPPPEDAEQAEAVRAAVAASPLYLGSLVARDYTVTLIVAELLDESDAYQSYIAVRDILATITLPAGVSLHVAGEGAVSGYLGSYIDSDALRLNPLAGLIITLTIVLAFLRWSPALMCNVIIGASVLITVGAMAAADVSFFVITSALPVILIGISVADAIHIYSHYFDLHARQPELPPEELIVTTLHAMWRPLSFTTLTTMFGFLGLYFAAGMPPFRYFGLFACVGVFVALCYSLLFLPAAMALTGPRAHPRYQSIIERGGLDFFGRVMRRLGNLTMGNPRSIAGGFSVVALLGLVAASQLEIDEARIDIFHPSEPIYRADKLINRHMDGSNTLDIVVETGRAEGLLNPDYLRKIESLQQYAQTLPGVGGSLSIVDYLKQINQALNEGNPEYFRVPDTTEEIAQFFLLYSMASDPTDFEEEVDYDYQTANIRVNINRGSYQEIKPIVEALEAYVATSFNEAGLSANLSGRVNLNYHWFKGLEASHFAGLAVALVLVWASASMLFNSPVAGLFTLIPVAFSVLLIYAAMVLFGMTLGIGTSMFAAVAIGLGIDFAIHTLDRVRRLAIEYGGEIEPALKDFYPSTGRALLFNYLAIASGFAVLITSKIVSLNSFGSIVVLAVSVSFFASLTLLPAVLYLVQPEFIKAPRPWSYAPGVNAARAMFVAAVVLGVCWVAIGATN